MADIKSLFDDALTFERRVEKVITFSNRQPDVLRNEARDYVLTDNLSDQYRSLLRHFDDAQSGDGAPECCVWLSGFYGSGKSSFAKYFGLSFDPGCQIGDDQFYELFSARFESSALKQEIRTQTRRYGTTVFLLDLAAQGIADANNTSISTLLFDKVAQWAGFPKDRKIADLSTRLLKDGKYDEFCKRISETAGLPYEELQSEPMLLIPLASELAHEFYPQIWKTPETFLNTQEISTVDDQERTKQMLDLIEQKSGSRRVLFVVDEVGHFLKNNEGLINNLDGLAKNLKEIGQGKAWLIATAQQTIPKSGPLFGLQDRFPIKIDLKASDIREITHKRLLKKSPDGQKALKQLFTDHGQKLTLSTQLSGDQLSKNQEIILNERRFLDFYPLLPQQFHLLIGAITALAKMHGGVGLRSAIRCVEDILLRQDTKGHPFISQKKGTLVTLAQIYAILQKDLVAANREITLHVDAIAAETGENTLEHQVAMGIAVLQQIEGFPASRENLAALLHPSVDSPPLKDAVSDAIDSLKSKSTVPIGETDGILSYLSEAVSLVEQERNDKIPCTSTNREQIQSDVLRELFHKPPRTMLLDTKSIDAGVYLFDGHSERALVGQDKDIRFLIRFCQEDELESTRTQLIQESLGSHNQAKVYACGILPTSVRPQLAEIHRSDEICRIHRNDADPEVTRYLEGQKQLAVQKRAEVKETLRKALSEGWFVYRGQADAIDRFGDRVEPAATSRLSTVAADVFEHYSKAPMNVKATVAEQFLNTNDLTQITSERDPLGLVKRQGTETHINVDHPALAAIMGFFQKVPNPDGKRILNEFANTPFGWNKETTRYLLAALFYAGKIKLKVNGEDLTVIGDNSRAAFKNNSSFAKVTITQNLNEISDEVRQTAARRLAELTGESVIPLAQRIAEVAQEHIPRFQKEIQGLPIKLQRYGIETSRAARLENSLIDSLSGDGAAATELFGVPDSEIYEDILWARNLAKAFDKGCKSSLETFNTLKGQAGQATLPQLIPGFTSQWEQEVQDLESRISEGSFVDDLPALASKIDELHLLSQKESQTYATEERGKVENQIQSILTSPGFQAVDESLKESFTARATKCMPSIDPTISGILSAPLALMDSQSKLNQLEREITQAGTLPQPVLVKDPKPDTTPKPGTEIKSISKNLTTPAHLDSLKEDLESLRPALEEGKEITLHLE
ncbi:BREX system P-loop protein BrxC [Akkermansiaceae bacterium]|nr:BREX system P-loop protein BrxC [Akkermansiaceae bacterium]